MKANGRRPLFVHLAPEERVTLDRLVAETGASVGRKLNASDVVRYLLQHCAHDARLRKQLVTAMIPTT